MQNVLPLLWITK